MATPTPQSERIDAQLQYLAGTLVDLEDIAPDWDQAPAHVKQAWHMEWRNDMDTVEHLQEQADRRVLSEEQQKAFIGLLASIQRLLPTIQRLNLDVPRVVLKA